MNTRSRPLSTDIGATARNARQLADGSWLTLELTASRTVWNTDPDADVPDAARLGRQLQGAVDEWFAELPTRGPRTANTPRASGSGVKRAAAGRGVEGPAEPAQVSDEPARTLNCPDHPGSVMRLRSPRDGGVPFYSHNDESTGRLWCNQRPL
jgi:hypothetical protein